MRSDQRLDCKSTVRRNSTRSNAILWCNSFEGSAGSEEARSEFSYVYAPNLEHV